MWLKKRSLSNIWIVPKCLTYSWSNDWICYWQCCLSIRRYSTNFRAKHWRKFDLCYSIHSGLLHRKCVELLFCQTTLFNLLENSRRLGKRKKNEIEQMASCGLMVRTTIVNAHSCIILIFCFAGLFPLFVFLLQHLMDWLMDIASVDFAI